MTVPVTVRTITPGETFNPGSGLPTITPTGVLISNQTVLDNILLAAYHASIQLGFVVPGGGGTVPFPLYVMTVNGTGPDSAGNVTVAGGGAVTSVATRTGDVVLTKADVSLANADNTSDINKPVSTAQATAIALKADAAATATALSAKADAAATTTALSAKADAAATTTSLAAKADAAATTASLALKADLAAMNAYLAHVAVTVIWDGTGAQPARPVTVAGVPCDWRCPTLPTGGGTVGGGTTAVNGLDFWDQTTS